MKLYMMTDLEGVAGVLNGTDYLYPHSRYYDTAKRLLTDEVNAAIEGFRAHGFDDILVADGHGHGGIDPDRLSRDARLSRGWPARAYPFSLDAGYDAAVVIGQHAKAGTPFSHLTHTGSWRVKDQRINGVSIGEYGQLALCAGELGVPIIFASGERALCEEAISLTPWTTTAAVLEGAIGGSGDDLNEQQYESFHEGAVHLHPVAACELIRRMSENAAERFHDDRGAFRALTLTPPYRLETDYRVTNNGPAKTLTFEHRSSIIELLNDSIH